MILCAQSENVRNIWIVSFSFAIEAAALIEAKNKQTKEEIMTNMH